VPAVRAEYGPTLPELVGPRVRALSPVGRIALIAAAAALAVAAAIVLRGRDGPPQTAVVVHRPVAFNLRFKSVPLRRTTPPAGGSLALRTVAGRAPERMVVRPLRLGPYRGDPTVAAMMLIPRMIDELRATLPRFAFRSEGRTRVNDAPGYQLQYQAQIGGRLVYGRRVLLLPQTEADPSPREGVQVDLRSARSASVFNIDMVGNNGPLKTPFRSLRFGTAAP